MDDSHFEWLKVKNKQKKYLVYDSVYSKFKNKDN